jgi:hypothetical protein
MAELSEATDQSLHGKLIFFYCRCFSLVFMESVTFITVLISFIDVIL